MKDIKLLERCLFLKYEYKDFTIRISNSNETELIGFAVKTKFSHLINEYNYYELEELIGADKLILEDEASYFVIDPFHDETLIYLEGIDTESSDSILNYLIKMIDL